MSWWGRTTAAFAVACGLGIPATASPDAAVSYWFVKQPEASGATAAFPLVTVRAGAIVPGSTV